MSRQDYILRLIWQFGQVWARLVNQLKAGAFPSARATLDQAYQQVLGLALHDVRVRSSAELLARVRFGVTPEEGRDRSFVLSALLKAEGDLAAATHGETFAVPFYQKALDVVLATRALYPDAPPPDFAPVVEQLHAALAQQTLPPDTLRRLLHFYEGSGAYAKAEDMVFEWLDHGPTSAALTEGAAFYDRLERLSDAQLHAGDFSRREVAAGRDALRGYQM